MQMNNNLKDNILHICSLLGKHDVQYLIIGRTAFALHGYFRQSRNLSGQISEKPDSDFWYNSTYDNYFKLLKALQDLLFQRREIVKVAETEIYFLGYKNLLDNKKKTGRLKDLDDVEHLKQIKKNNSSDSLL